MKLKKTYSSREVAALTGLTARQLQLWDAGGLLSPTIPSHATAAGGHTERRYTPIELFELLVLADLRRRGFTIHEPKVGLVHERRGLQDVVAALGFQTCAGHAPQFVVDGRQQTIERCLVAVAPIE